VGIIVGQDNLKTYIFEYYKNLLGAPSQNNFSMIESEINDIPQLSEEENNILIADFSEKEVHDAIMQMEKKIRRWDRMVSRLNFTKDFGIL
jgi:ADP-dependent phosphofructokinase/glucokinase